MFEKVALQNRDARGEKLFQKKTGIKSLVPASLQLSKPVSVCGNPINEGWKQ
jgi:hypothetical protein